MSVTTFTIHICDDRYIRHRFWRDFLQDFELFSDAFNGDTQPEDDTGAVTPPTKVFCMRCPRNVKNEATKDNESSDAGILLDRIPDGDIGMNKSKSVLRVSFEMPFFLSVISNANLELVFDEDTRLLSTIKEKSTGQLKNVQVQFGGYPTVPFRNGAYLFKPDTEHQPDILTVIDPVDDLKEVVVISGPVFSEISVIYEAGSSAANQGSFVHTVRLYHSQLDSPLTQGIYMENNFNLGDQNNFRDVDIFMRLASGLRNPGNVWYSDSSGLSMQRRVPAVNASGLEGNTYPITSQIYLEDNDARLTLLVDHATGASSQKQGWLEVIVDRRASYDDARGMGEGILDSRDTEHRYWLLFEAVDPNKTFTDDNVDTVSIPTSLANHMSRRLNYPPAQFVCSSPSCRDSLRKQARGLAQPLPHDLHLFNLRSLSDPDAYSKPSASALLILHHQLGDCTFARSNVPGELPKKP